METLFSIILGFFLFFTIIVFAVFAIFTYTENKPTSDLLRYKNELRGVLTFLSKELEDNINIRMNKNRYPDDRGSIVRITTYEACYIYEKLDIAPRIKYLQKRIAELLVKINKGKEASKKSTSLEEDLKKEGENMLLFVLKDVKTCESFSIPDVSKRQMAHAISITASLKLLNDTLEHYMASFRGTDPTQQSDIVLFEKYRACEAFQEAGIVNVLKTYYSEYSPDDYYLQLRLYNMYKGTYTEVKQFLDEVVLGHGCTSPLQSVEHLADGIVKALTAIRESLLDDSLENTLGKKCSALKNADTKVKEYFVQYYDMVALDKLYISYRIYKAFGPLSYTKIMEVLKAILESECFR